MNNTKLTIKGKRVTLRPLALSDAKRFVTWLSDPEVTLFLTIHGKGPSLAEERKWITTARKSKTGIHLAIDADDGEHIGSISLRKFSSVDKNAEFGIAIGNKKYWGQGCGTEATRLLCGYGFKKLKLHRIYLSAIGFNVRGIKAYQKVGFKIEGRQRQHYFREGHFHDQVIMGVLKHEFKK